MTLYTGIYINSFVENQLSKINTQSSYWLYGDGDTINPLETKALSYIRQDTSAIHIYMTFVGKQAEKASDNKYDDYPHEIKKTSFNRSDFSFPWPPKKPFGSAKLAVSPADTFPLWNIPIVIQMTPRAVWGLTMQAKLVGNRCEKTHPNGDRWFKQTLDLYFDCSQTTLCRYFWQQRYVLQMSWPVFFSIVKNGYSQNGLSAQPMRLVKRMV